MVSGRHSVVVLGEIGDHTRIDSLRKELSSRVSGSVTSLTWEPVFLEELEQVAHSLLELDPLVICIGQDVDVDSSFALTNLILGVSPTIEILLVRHATTDLWSRAMRLGAREIISPTVDDEELFESITRAVDRGARLRSHLTANSADGRASTSKVIAIVSPKGGSGKTTIAVNMATAIAERAPERTLLIDFDCQFGDVATMIGLEPERTLTELGSLPEIDATSMKLFVSRDSTGSLFVLPSSGSPEEADLIEKGIADKILQVASQSFDYVIVDTAAGIDERTISALSIATDVVFVASMDVTSIRNLIKELQILRRMRFSDQRHHFVINRVTTDSGLQVKDIIDAVGMPVTQEIEASILMLQRANLGLPIVISDPKANVAKQIASLAAVFISDSEEKDEKKSFWRGLRGDKKEKPAHPSRRSKRKGGDE